ncbi:MAG: ABC transporter permease [Clostridia bacterium]|nr:MAG: ABC transporter permease [Clostridia bacterium]
MVLTWRDLAIGIALIGLAWWALAAAVSNPAFPGPLPAADALARLLVAGELAAHLAASAWRVLASLAVSLVLAVPLGLVLGRKQAWDRVLAPAVYLLYPVPKIVLLPLIMVLAGIGEVAKITVIFLVIFFQLLVTTRDAARAIPVPTVLSVKSLGAGEGDIYRHVVIPACLPAILTGVRISLGTAISVLFFAETVAGTSGLGYAILDAWHRAAYSQMFAAILAMSLLGLSFYYIIDLLERWWCRWQYL